jgi:DHA1 family bicyclomycin/chloramphenicol resistance-like MFS transporter
MMNGSQSAPLPAGDATHTMLFRMLLVAFTAVGPFSLNIFKPCLPWIRADFHIPIDTVQLALSLSIVASAAVTIVSGWLSDHLGRRPVLLFSTHVYIASSALCAVAPGIWILIIGRIVQAASSTVGLVLSRSIVQDVYGKGNTTVVFGRLAFVGMALVVVAPMFGGALIEVSSWRMVFAATTAAGLLIVFFAHRHFPETRPTGDNSDGGAENSGINPFRSPVYYGYVGQSSLHFAVFFAFSSVSTYLMVEVLHRPAMDYGLWFLALAASLAGGVALAGRIADRTGNARLVLIGSFIAFAGGLIGAHFLVAEQLTPIRLFIPATLSGFGMGVTLPAALAGSTAVNPGRAGIASGFMSLMHLTVAAVLSPTRGRVAGGSNSRPCKCCGGWYGHGLHI